MSELMAVGVPIIEYELVISHEDMVSLREYVLFSWRVRYPNGSTSPESLAIYEVTDGNINVEQGMPL